MGGCDRRSVVRGDDAPIIQHGRISAAIVRIVWIDRPVRIRSFIIIHVVGMVNVRNHGRIRGRSAGIINDARSGIHAVQAAAVVINIRIISIIHAIGGGAVLHRIPLTGPIIGGRPTRPVFCIPSAGVRPIIRPVTVPDLDLVDRIVGRRLHGVDRVVRWRLDLVNRVIYRRLHGASCRSSGCRGGGALLSRGTKRHV